MTNDSVETMTSDSRENMTSDYGESEDIRMPHKLSVSRDVS